MHSTSAICLGVGLSAALAFGCARGKSESSAPTLAMSAAVSTPTAASAPAPAAAAASAPDELLKPGSPLPNLVATAQTGERVDFAALKGKKVVVYFYPKDETAGCTIEAEEIRDLWQEIRKEDATVIGVSSDDEASHRAFSKNHALPFLLLPDPEHELATAFHVPLNNGRTKRTTFVFGADGRLAKVFPNVQPKGHANELLLALRTPAPKQQ
jgi:peroxiredoxin Q/BCP